MIGQINIHEQTLVYPICYTKTTTFHLLLLYFDGDGYQFILKYILHPLGFTVDKNFSLRGKRPPGIFIAFTFSGLNHVKVTTPLSLSMPEIQPLTDL